jgi:hypothetical protein
MFLYIFATFPKKNDWVVLSYNRSRGRGNAPFLHSYTRMSYVVSLRVVQLAFECLNVVTNFQLRGAKTIYSLFPRIAALETLV